MRNFLKSLKSLCCSSCCFEKERENDGENPEIASAEKHNARNENFGNENIKKENAGPAKQNTQSERRNHNKRSKSDDETISSGEQKSSKKQEELKFEKNNEHRRAATTVVVHPSPDHCSDKIVRSPRGLYNTGNTCYFNSVMQPLFHTYGLYEELCKVDQKGNVSNVSNTFCKTCNEMQNGDQKPMVPKNIRSEFIKRVPRFNNSRQHDSHECLRHFLDEIRKEERKEKDSSSGNGLLTAVDKVFGGHLITVYICKECDRHYHLFEPCLDISLPVFFEVEKRNENEMAYGVRKDGFHLEQTTEGQKHYNRHEIKEVNKDNEYKQCIETLTARLSTESSSSNDFPRRGRINLHDCLRHFSRVEQIDNEYLCEDCLREAMAIGKASEDNLKLTSATKQTLIFNPPAVLTIHFKRFELLPGRSKKRSDMVEYPEYLDIAPYCSSQCLRNDPPKMNIWYSLYAVVVHSGSLDSGHYVAYVKVRDKNENIEKLKKFLQQKYFNHNVTSDELIGMIRTNFRQKKISTKSPERDESNERDESKWFLLNDNSVGKVEISEVLRQEAYLLLYERTDGAEITHTASSNDRSQFVGIGSNIGYSKDRSQYLGIDSSMENSKDRSQYVGTGDSMDTHFGSSLSLSNTSLKTRDAKFFEISV